LEIVAGADVSIVVRHCCVNELAPVGANGLEFPLKNRAYVHDNGGGDGIMDEIVPKSGGRIGRGTGLVSWESAEEKSGMTQGRRPSMIGMAVFRVGG
jgi:hypothetical protein